MLFIRNEGKLARDRTPADGMMDKLSTLVGAVVDRVVRHPGLYTIIGVTLFALFALLICNLSRATGSPIRCPTASRRCRPATASTLS
jgi:hypothetical protein